MLQRWLDIYFLIERLHHGEGNRLKRLAVKFKAPHTL